MCEHSNLTCNHQSLHHHHYPVRAGWFKKKWNAYKYKIYAKPVYSDICMAWLKEKDLNKRREPGHGLEELIWLRYSPQIEQDPWQTPNQSSNNLLDIEVGIFGRLEGRAGEASHVVSGVPRFPSMILTNPTGSSILGSKDAVLLRALCYWGYLGNPGNARGLRVAPSTV